MPVSTVVKSIEHTNGDHKVEIFRRDNGSFGFEVLKWADLEQTWMAHGRYSACITESAADAEQQARARIDWLACE